VTCHISRERHRGRRETSEKEAKTGKVGFEESGDVVDEFVVIERTMKLARMSQDERIGRSMMRIASLEIEEFLREGVEELEIHNGRMSEMRKEERRGKRNVGRNIENCTEMGKVERIPMKRRRIVKKEKRSKK
jgi:hypothetical protein